MDNDENSGSLRKFANYIGAKPVAMLSPRPGSLVIQNDAYSS